MNDLWGFNTQFLEFSLEGYSCKILFRDICVILYDMFIVKYLENVKIIIAPF